MKRRIVAVLAVLSLAAPGRADEVRFETYTPTSHLPSCVQTSYSFSDVPTAVQPTPLQPGEVFDNPALDATAGRAVVEADLTAAACPVARPNSWYVRLDAYSWSEVINHNTVVSESGTLATLGQVLRRGQSRYRLELLGGVMDYDGEAQFAHHTVPFHQANSVTHLGCRGEYDFLIEPQGWTRTRLVLGVGTRLWIRSIEDGVLPWGQAVRGYDETWWTFYPYLGIESRESTEPGLHFFGSARFGLTPYTYEHSSLDITLHPQCGVTAQAELGLRGRRLALSCFMEAMTWEESAIAKGWFQPASAYGTLGLRLALSY